MSWLIKGNVAGQQRYYTTITTITATISSIKLRPSTLQQVSIQFLLSLKLRYIVYFNNWLSPVCLFSFFIISILVPGLFLKCKNYCTMFLWRAKYMFSPYIFSFFFPLAFNAALRFYSLSHFPLCSFPFTDWQWQWPTVVVSVVALLAAWCHGNF